MQRKMVDADLLDQGKNFGSRSGSLECSSGTSEDWVEIQHSEVSTKKADERSSEGSEESDKAERGEASPSLEADLDGEDDSEAKARIEAAEECKIKGNNFFAESCYEAALEHYTAALSNIPLTSSTVTQRSIYYANRAACHVRLQAFQEAIRDCSSALELQPDYIKALIRRGCAHESIEQWEQSEADAKRALELDEGNVVATKLLERVGPKAEAKREELKEEMINKLKDLGNTVLGKFGMSLDNFKAEKDPKTGGYSIKFG